MHGVVLANSVKSSPFCLSDRNRDLPLQPEEKGRSRLSPHQDLLSLKKSQKEVWLFYGPLCYTLTNQQAVHKIREYNTWHGYMVTYDKVRYFGAVLKRTLLKTEKTNLLCCILHTHKALLHKMSYIYKCNSFSKQLEHSCRSTDHFCTFSCKYLCCE